MAKKVLMKGNEALGEAAIASGCKYFFGYPITPQNELPAYLSKRLPKIGGVFLQAESEIAAINMVYGAAAAGVRAMTSSSSPGISLKQEGISYICGAELPCLIVNVQRGGPGLGSIQPAQADYFQATKGGGHGDYRLIVLAPSTVQEVVDLVPLAFDLADEYRNPALILADGLLGQLMEPVEFTEYAPKKFDKSWATDGCKGRKPNIVNSLQLDPAMLEKHNLNLQAKYEKIKQTQQRAEEFMADDAEILLVAYGTMARIVKSAVKEARGKGLKAGMLRPITLWPYPDKYFENTKNWKKVLTVEMSAGQMVEDVKLAIGGRLPVHFHGRMGGMVPSVEELVEQIEKLVKNKVGV